jgi:hypothetical protein
LQKSAEGSKYKAFSRCAESQSSLYWKILLFHPIARKGTF